MNSDSKSNLVDLLQKIDDLKSEINKFHPLPTEIEDRIFQKYRLDWNYNSNAIEGNTLNYGETYAFLMHGITASGKPLKDYLDIRGHNEAINYLINLVRNKEELTEAVIRELHKVILVESYETDALTQNGKLTKKTVTLGAYKTQPNHVKTATCEIHYFASPQETPAKMDDLMKWYRAAKNDKETHPVILAAIFHHRFAEIHPFDDGNGRLARLLMNLILMQNNFPPAIIKTKDRNNYYLALSQADIGDTKKFVEYVADALIHSMEIYLKGAKGESIDEPDDLDKEIAVLKKALNSREDKFEKFSSHEVYLETLKISFFPLIQSINSIIEKISDMFGVKNLSYRIYYNNYQNKSNRKKLNNIDLLDLITDLTILREEHLNSIVVTYDLTKFKVKNNSFNLSVQAEVIFYEYDFIILFKLYSSNSPKKSINVDYRLHEGQWLERVSYEFQLTQNQFEDAKKIINSEVINYIKNKSNEVANE